MESKFIFEYSLKAVLHLIILFFIISLFTIGEISLFLYLIDNSLK